MQVVRLTGVKGLRPADDAPAGTPLEGTVTESLPLVLSTVTLTLYSVQSHHHFTLDQAIANCAILHF